MQKNQLEELNQKLSLAEGVCQEVDKDQEILEKNQKVQRDQDQALNQDQNLEVLVGYRPFGEEHGHLDRPGFGGPHGPLDRPGFGGPPWPRLGGSHEPHGFHGPGLGGRPAWTPRTRIRYTTWIDG